MGIHVTMEFWSLMRIFLGCALPKKNHGFNKIIMKPLSQQPLEPSNPAAGRSLTVLVQGDLTRQVLAGDAITLTGASWLMGPWCLVVGGCFLVRGFV